MYWGKRQWQFTRDQCMSLKSEQVICMCAWPSIHAIYASNDLWVEEQNQGPYHERGLKCCPRPPLGLEQQFLWGIHLSCQIHARYFITVDIRCFLWQCFCLTLESFSSYSWDRKQLPSPLCPLRQVIGIMMQGWSHSNRSICSNACSWAAAWSDCEPIQCVPRKSNNSDTGQPATTMVYSFHALRALHGKRAFFKVLCKLFYLLLSPWQDTPTCHSARTYLITLMMRAWGCFVWICLVDLEAEKLLICFLTLSHVYIQLTSCFDLQRHEGRSFWISRFVCLADPGPVAPGMTCIMRMRI